MAWMLCSGINLQKPPAGNDGDDMIAIPSAPLTPWAVCASLNDTPLDLADP